MLETDSSEILNLLMSDLKVQKRKTKGQDKSKNYHKITISINEQDKNDVLTYANEKGISVSMLIKNLLQEQGIIRQK